MTDDTKTPSVASRREQTTAKAERLATDPSQGLSNAEAKQRLETYGANELDSAPPVPLWRRIVRELTNTLTLVLLVATLISGVEWVIATPREAALPYEAVVILLIVVLNVVLDLVQESRADTAVRALRNLSAPEASVIREGRRQRVPARELVPGDLLIVEAGDTVAADAQLVEAANLRIEESALTGESLPVVKSVEPVVETASLGDRKNMLFSGTAVAVGRGHAIVHQTGKQTEIGKIARLVEGAQKERTPLEKELERVGKRLSVTVLIICFVVFVGGILTGRVHGTHSILTFALFAVAIAVAAIPEALPTVVTSALAIGTRRMAARNAIIRRLPAVETLGAATVICTDKTGTLTLNRMTVRNIVTSDGEISLEGKDNLLGSSPLALQNSIRRTLRAGALANDATLTREGETITTQGDPTEAALLVAAHTLAVDIDHERFPRQGELPFTADRKRHATLHADSHRPDTWRVFVKGAPDVLLERCLFVYVDGECLPMTPERHQRVQEQNAALTHKALRTLAMAERMLPRPTDAPPSDDVSEEIEQELVFLGLVAMQDPPRPEAAEAVGKAQRAGIRVVMATGDHRETALAIARELGILTPEGRSLTGPELEEMSDAELDAIVETVQVYARVAPAHKMRIIQSWQRRGDIVAMTGDGVNDAPALRAADIGIAMGITGTDVAREAADMILADDNFATIIHAVEEGRGIFDNIRRCLFYLLECNVSEVLTMFLGILLSGLVAPAGASDLMLPLLAAQLLWLNLVTDGPPALALGVEPTAPDTMLRPPRDVRQGILPNKRWFGIASISLIMTAGTLLSLDAAYPGGLFTFAERFDDLPTAEKHARTLAFTTLVLFQIVNALTHRGAEGRSVFQQLGKSKKLLAALALAVGLQVAVIHLPFLQVAFATIPLTALEWLLCALIALSLLLVSEGKVALSGRVRAYRQPG